MNRTQISETPGCEPVIRLARPADLAALGDFFGGLSLRSRYQRFFVPVIPNQVLLRRMASTATAQEASAAAQEASAAGPDAGAAAGADPGADPDNLVASHGGGIIGHAMAADRATAGGERTTDIGVVVADAWQGRGVGSALVRELLARARGRGVTSVTMDVLHGNQQVLAMITSHWPASSISHCADYRTVRIRLPGRTYSSPPAAAPVPVLAHGASGSCLAGARVERAKVRVP